jgi:aminodeoxyfutalosine synthase
MPIPQSIRSNKLLSTAYSDLSSKGRISESTGLLLMDEAPLSGLTTLASMVKQSKHSDEVFFNENLHVNTTNICVLACRFCAFRKGPRHKDAYELSVEEYLHRIEPFAEHIDEVHSVGGLHPTWTVEHYAELYRQCKRRFPHIHIKSLTAIEIKHIAERSNLSVGEVIATLKESGLDSIPGGGAEILVDSVRDRICRGKESSQEYLDIHRAAHKLERSAMCLISIAVNDLMWMWGNLRLHCLYSSA